MTVSKIEYNVYMNNILAASNMSIEVACILVKGLTEKYWCDTDLEITIKRVNCEVQTDD